MRQFITNSWHGVMNHRKNPLRHVPDENVRHLIVLILQNTGDKYGKYKKSYISRCNQATTRRG